MMLLHEYLTKLSEIFEDLLANRNTKESDRVIKGFLISIEDKVDAIAILLRERPLSGSIPILTRSLFDVVAQLMFIGLSRPLNKTLKYSSVRKGTMTCSVEMLLCIFVSLFSSSTAVCLDKFLFVYFT